MNASSEDRLGDGPSVNGVVAAVSNAAGNHADIDLSDDVESTEVAEVAQVVAAVVAAAQAIEVRTPEEAAVATEFLGEIARQKRKGEEARKSLVKPLNDHVKRINATFQTAAVPLDEADQLVRGKVLAYNREQERIRAEEQARLDAERRERERVIEEQRRAAEAQARAEREAAEKVRREAELAARADDEASRRAAAVAREIEQAAILAEQLAAAPAPVAPVSMLVPAVALRSESGASAGVRKTWTATVEDASLLPRQYLKVDTVAINAAVKLGIREIPGVRIEQVDSLSVRA